MSRANWELLLHYKNERYMEHIKAPAVNPFVPEKSKLRVT